MENLSTASKQNISFIAMLIISVIASILIYHTTQQKWILYGAAESKYTHKDYAAAIPLYIRSMEKGETTPEAFSHLATSYVVIGNFSEAIRWYKIYLEKRPKDLDVRFELAKALTWNGNWEEAEREYEKLKEYGYEKKKNK